jgi:hypothetical protein
MHFLHGAMQGRWEEGSTMVRKNAIIIKSAMPFEKQTNVENVMLIPSSLVFVLEQVTVPCFAIQVSRK